MIELFKRPTGRGGWVVRRADLSEREQDTRLLALKAKQRILAVDRVVRKSLIDPRFDVTLPALQFLGHHKPVDESETQA